MKAIVQEGYGAADTLRLREIDTPVAGDDGVLVDVHAASVNALDWHVARGVPFFIPMLEAISAPKHRARPPRRSSTSAKDMRAERSSFARADPPETRR